MSEGVGTRLHKTWATESTIKELFIENRINEIKGSGMILPKSTTAKSAGFKTMSKAHVNEALTNYLRTISLIDNDEEVTNFNKAPDSLDVRIERVTS